MIIKAMKIRCIKNFYNEYLTADFFSDLQYTMEKVCVIYIQLYNVLVLVSIHSVLQTSIVLDMVIIIYVVYIM